MDSPVTTIGRVDSGEELAPSIEPGAGASRGTFRAGIYPILERLRSLRDLVPTGVTLPEEDWRARHRGILILLWAHVVGIPIYGLTRGFGLVHVLLEASAIAAAAAVASMNHLARDRRMIAATVGLVSSSGLLVHLSGGLIEMHFHFFVMVAVVSLYQSWKPFLLAIGFVLVHHGFLGVIDPASVYDHASAIAHPWTWAGIHALFIAGESVALLTAWRMNELASARGDSFDRQLATLVQWSDDAIIGLSAQHVVTSWNPAACRLFGYDAEEVVGHSVEALLPSPGAEAERIFQQIAGGTAVTNYETVVLGKGGSPVAISFTASPVTDNDGTFVGISAIVHDITKRKRAERDMAAARDKAIEISRLKSEFLANVSHEIRTPMNGVIGMTALLLDSNLSLDQREYAETIFTSGQALLEIINDVLDFSKIEAGKMRLEKTDFNVRAVVQEVTGLLRKRAQDKGLEITWSAQPDVPESVTGDPGQANHDPWGTQPFSC